MTAGAPSIGIIGCGRWGKNLIRVFNDVADVVVCCHSGNSQNRRWMADNYPSITLTTSFDQVLETELDAAVVATPIGTHYNLTRQLLNQGIPTFVEKPLTADPESAAELAELAEKRGVVLFVGYIFVHHPVFRRLLSIHTDTPFEYVGLEWHKFGAFDTDIIVNLGCHDLAMIYQLFGSLPESVMVTDSVKTFGTRNLVSIEASFEKATCHIRLNRLDEHKRKKGTFVTTAGDVYLWDDCELSLIVDPAGDSKTVFKTNREPLRVEAKRFLKCLKANRTPVTDGRFGAKVTELFDGL